MPRMANLRTGSTDHEYGQLSYNHTAYGKRNVAKCKFPPIPKKMNKTWKRNVVWGFIGTAFFLMACFVGVAIVLTVVFAVKSPNFGGYSSDSPGYALYKNTRFEECYSAPASTTNCTAIRDALVSLKNKTFAGFGDNNIGYLRSDKVRSGEKSHKDSKLISDACEAMGCFNGYKVIPSTPRDSAILPTPLTSWASSAGYIVGSLFQLLLQQKALYNPTNKPCKGLGGILWLLIGYDLISFVWWWVSFGKLAAAPESAATPLMVGWVIPWKYAGLFGYHPYSCAFRKHRNGKKITQCIFYILAAIQWIASLYVNHINRSSNWFFLWGIRAPNPSYDCVQSQIDAAPGASTCSATQICSRNWLFVDPGFEQLPADVVIVVMFGLLTATALGPAALKAIDSILPDKNRSSSGKAPDLGPYFLLSVFSFMAIIFGCGLVKDMVTRLSITPEAAFTFDRECQAIHIALSPWRYYIDVHYGRGWRIAKMWFNS